MVNWSRKSVYPVTPERVSVTRLDSFIASSAGKRLTYRGLVA
jgi:hypothetical protein